MNNKPENNSIPDLYGIFKENYEINQKIKLANMKKDKVNYDLVNYGKAVLSYKNDFAEVESIIGLKKNLEYFFYVLLPYFIQEYLVKNQSEINSLDPSKYKISTEFTLCYDYSGNKYISKFILPSNYNNNFDILLIKFIEEYNLGTVKLLSSRFGTKYYSISIEASLKDLMYACYIGKEWVKHLKDDCIDLLSDYYSEEQLDSFKKTLHR